MNGNNSPQRLHFGCGSVTPEGWVNTDLRSDIPGVVCGDVLQGLPWADGTFDYIVSHHVLCELKIYDQMKAMGELCRILRPGGVLRLSLADLDMAIDAYRRNDREYFPISMWKSLSGNLITYMLWHNISQTPFTYEFAEELLGYSGFSKVVRTSYQKTETGWADITCLDNRPEESFYLEATK